MNHKLGAFIKATRKHRRWSLRDMSTRCNVAFTTISRIENGHDCEFSALVEIARAFNMEVGDMLIAAGYTANQDVTFDAVRALALRALNLGLRELMEEET